MYLCNYIYIIYSIYTYAPHVNNISFSNILLEHVVERSSKDESSDLICPSTNLVQLSITEEPPGGIFTHVAITSCTEKN